MSTASAYDDDEFWAAVHRILADVPLADNRELTLRYLQERRANGIKPSTLASDANALRGFCLHIGEKTLESVTRQDVISYVNNAKSQRRWKSKKADGSETTSEKSIRLSPATINHRKVILKPFFKWLRGTDEYPPEVKNLKSRHNDPGMIPTDELVTREDLQGLIQAHADAQDKARLAVLYESGMRAGEFCSLNLASVAFDQFGAVLTMPKGAAGLKTGARRVRLFDSVPYLRAWYELHPKRENAKSPLWFTKSHRAPGARLTVTALWTFVHSAGVRAGLQKHLHPHLFRHSAATERARMGWNEGQMRAFFGWSRNSDMPSRYVHLAGLDYEDVELERRGLRGKGERSGPALAPILCRVCKTANVPTAAFCTSCRNPVSPKAEEELERAKHDEIKDAASRIVADSLREQIARAVQDALAREGK